MEFGILHWMGDPSNPNASLRRKRQELYYIWAFPTLHSAGINICLYEVMPSHSTPYPGAPLYLYLCSLSKKINKQCLREHGTSP